MSEPVVAIDSIPARLPAQPAGTVRQYLLLCVGVFACATSVLFLKACTSHPIIVASARLLIAAVVLSPMMVIDLRRSQRTRTQVAARVLRSIPGAVFLAVHFILWSTGARLTPAANATMIVNLAPIALPFVMWLVNRERVNRGEVIGTLIAISGVAALMGHGFSVGDGTFRGDVVCFLAMLVFCFYISIGRRIGQGSGLWAYVVPMYGMAGVICLIVAVVMRVPWPVITLAEVSRWVGLGLVPTVIGHSIFNYSIKHLRGQTISTLNLAQLVYAGVLAYFIFGEVPPAKMYVVAAVIAVGVVIVIRSSPTPPPTPEE